METKNKTISRAINAEQIVVRSDSESGKRYFEFYPIVFNQKSKLIREWGEVFYEVIEPGAPDNVLSDPGLNVIATVDHKREKMLGRTKSGTLELSKDEKGVKAIVEVPNTTLGNDTAELVSRGDYYECSFIFSIAEKGMRYDRSEDIPTRYISDFSALRDVAIVIDGAYANTNVKLRAQEWDNEAEICPPDEGDEEQRDGGGDAAALHDILHKEIEIIQL